MNDKGIAQTAALRERLKDAGVAAVFSSPIRRALETAEAIACGRVIIEPALSEVNFGEWEGRTFSELHRVESWKRFNTFRSATRVPGGEMMIEVQARVVGLLERLSGQYGEQVIALVSHADVIRCVLCHYLGMPLDFLLRLAIEPASITTLRISEWGAELLGLNSRSPE